LISDHWNIAVAGLADDRVWPILEDWQACPGAIICAAADPREDLRWRAHHVLGIPRLYASWQEMIVREDIHFLQIGVSPRSRPELVANAALRGAHCLLIGPMAASIEGAEQILAARREHGISILVHWPAGFNPAVVHAIRAVEEQLIGSIRQVWARISHSPDWSPACRAWMSEPRESGGGVVAETISRGANVCRLAIGMPEAVMATTVRTTRDQAETADTAAVTLSYPNAMGLIEGDWTGGLDEGIPDLVLRGSQGALIVMGRRLDLVREGSRLELPVPPLTEDTESPAAALIAAALSGDEIHGLCNPVVGRDTQEILEAAVLSIERGQRVRLPLR